ncbi:MAG: hypothetical protein ACXWBO_07925 [Ilumatobacteraceae bacterium]
MPNALRNAAESTAHVISDLVDDARDRIEDLPLGHLHRRSNNKRWTLILVAVLLGMIFVVAGRRHRHEAAETSTPGARLAEKSLAVS